MISDDNLEFFTGYSLVDITKTGILSQYNSSIPPLVDSVGYIIDSSDTWLFSRNRQRNWETIIQVISLRSQPIILNEPELLANQSLKNYQFGKAYSGNKFNVWVFSFGVENGSVYGNSENELYWLEQDMNNIPIITGLTETESHEPRTLNCFGSNRNIYFKTGKTHHTNILNNV